MQKKKEIQKKDEQHQLRNTRKDKEEKNQENYRNIESITTIIDETPISRERRRKIMHGVDANNVKLMLKIVRRR